MEAEARAFWRVRRRLAVATIRQALVQMRFRIGLVTVLGLFLWIGLFVMFCHGFDFLKTGIQDQRTHDDMVRIVFCMFFGALMVMLIFSSGIILYGSLFRSREIAFLLSSPVRTQRVFLHKFQEAVLLSSWGFLLLGSPMLLAFGISTEAPWYYYPIMPAFLVAFVYIPAGLGAILCLTIVRHVPQYRLKAVVIAGALLLIVAVWYTWTTITGPESDILTPSWFRDMLARLKFSEQRLLPSWWISSGLLQAAREVWSDAVLFLTLLVANALFIRQLAIWIAGCYYRKAYNVLYGRPVGRRVDRTAWVERFARWAVSPFPHQIRLLLTKDFRLFRRDPVQWSQFLIFFGLLALYFVNIRQFDYNDRYIGWVNMISFLNLSVVGLLMSTFTTRFVFPMISLESQRFWLLGLLPVRRETILWSKFLFAAGGSIIPCSLLIMLSDVMLHVNTTVMLSHQLTCVILCVGLAGIAVGLGARLPNLRETSPARIAAGFGGTLNLVVSTLYILIVVLLTALPYHFYLAAESSTAARILPNADETALLWWLQVWLWVGNAGCVVLGLLATILPLQMGFRAFRRLEF